MTSTRHEPAGTDTGAAGPGSPSGSGRVGRTPTRASAAWTAAIGATVLLLLLVVFVAQNTQRGQVNFLVWHGRAPIAVLLLVATVTGAALVAVAGIARILQLRHRASHAPADAGVVASTGPPD